MQVNVPDDFPYPTFFVVAGRATGVPAAPVEALGVLIMKQTIQMDGTVSGQEEILLKDDTEFDPLPPMDPPLDEEKQLKIRLESDLVAYKPDLDIAVVRNSLVLEPFGTISVDRGMGFGPSMALSYGWRDRTTNSRKDEAGDVANFQPVAVDPANPPPLLEKLKLPDNFQNRFWNGGRLSSLAHLQAGDRVEFAEYDEETETFTEHPVTILSGPSLTIKANGRPISPPVSIDLGVDTVVYNVSASHFLVTWRAVFPWEDRLDNATLEVN